MFTDQQLEALKHAFGQLPRRCRMIMHLIDEDGMSYATVAQNLGIDEVLVRRLEARALEYLSEALAPRPVELKLPPRRG
jgi:RNA polymerase sigma factor (sigma-70 family)